ncbi:MAG: hypothetical protein SGPRY_007710, partial [Prymnesium sp.]
AVEFVESVIEELELGGEPNRVTEVAECAEPLLALKQRYVSLTGEEWSPMVEEDDEMAESGGGSYDESTMKEDDRDSNQ